MGIVTGDWFFSGLNFEVLSPDFYQLARDIAAPLKNKLDLTFKGNLLLNQSRIRVLAPRPFYITSSPQCDK